MKNFKQPCYLSLFKIIENDSTTIYVRDNISGYSFLVFETFCKSFYRAIFSLSILTQKQNYSSGEGHTLNYSLLS